MPESVERLLNALVAMELLTKADDTYSNTPSSLKLLSKDSPQYPGRIIIHEFILNNSMDGPLFPALFSLNMMLGTDRGRAYSERQLTDMLAAAGAKNIQRLPVQTPNDSGIITGIV